MKHVSYLDQIQVGTLAELGNIRFILNFQPVKNKHQKHNISFHFQKFMFILFHSQYWQIRQNIFLKIPKTKPRERLRQMFTKYC